MEDLILSCNLLIRYFDLIWIRISLFIVINIPNIRYMSYINNITHIFYISYIIHTFNTKYINNIIPSRYSFGGIFVHYQFYLFYIFLNIYCLLGLTCKRPGNVNGPLRVQSL